ncbi:MAG: hypothetical protein MJ010_08980 [Paludibacteraceae bacterium]|nr:hypothetical protein [Paludibacteraceae bacterium]
MKRFAVIIILFSVSLIALAQSDTLTQQTNPFVKRSWFAVPIAFYQEETSVGFGATGGYYFNSSSLSKISSISGSVIYTILNQAKVNINPRIYSKNKKWYFTGNANFKYYPDIYYGIGNGGLPKTAYLDSVNLAGKGMHYTSESFEIKFSPSYYVLDNFAVGLNLAFQWEKMIVKDSNKGTYQEIKNVYGSAGWNPYFMWGLGAYIQYDSRDNQFYPQKFSNFVKLSALTYNKALGSSYDVTSVTLDVRQYIPTWVGQVFAWQVYADARFGRDVPFRMLPTIGGSDNLRGFRERKFTDKFMWMVQAEYRIPIWWRLKAAVFCSFGDVMDIYDPTYNKLKVGYGLGLRCRLNQARVNLRFDVSFNNYGEYKFNITATEAF